MEGFTLVSVQATQASVEAAPVRAEATLVSVEAALGSVLSARDCVEAALIGVRQTPTIAAPHSMARTAPIMARFARPKKNVATPARIFINSRGDEFPPLLLNSEQSWCVRDSLRKREVIWQRTKPSESAPRTSRKIATPSRRSKP